MLLNLDRAREHLERERLDGLVCVLPKNVYYLSDYESDWLFDLPWAACAILPRDGAQLAACLIVHDVELTNLAERPTWMPRVQPYCAAVDGVSFPHYAVTDRAALDATEEQVWRLEEALGTNASSSSLQAAVRCLAQMGLAGARLGFDDLRFAAACAARLPRLRTRDALGTLNSIRAVKSPDEVAIMREGARRNQRAIEAALAAVRCGVRWSEIRRTYAVAASEADCQAFSFFVGAGRKSMGLWADHDYPVSAGDQVCIDAMLTHRRYFADAQCTAVLGDPSPKLERYYEAVKRAAEECYGLVAPGVSTGTLRKRAIEIVRSHGIPHFRHAFVHGLGLDHLELPGEGREFGAFDLEPGMVVNMDLEVCELGFGGIYFERTVLVTRDGSEPLYGLSDELIRLH